MPLVAQARPYRKASPVIMLLLVLVPKGPNELFTTFGPQLLTANFIIEYYVLSATSTNTLAIACYLPGYGLVILHDNSWPSPDSTNLNLSLLCPSWFCVSLGLIHLKFPPQSSPKARVSFTNSVILFMSASSALVVCDALFVCVWSTLFVYTALPDVY